MDLIVHVYLVVTLITHTMKKLLTIIFAVAFQVFVFGQADTLTYKNNLSVSLKVLNDSQIFITVKNTSNKLIKAYSHVETYEKHYDYFEIEALTPDHDEMVFSFFDDRDRSAPFIVELKPDESFSHTIDLLQWSERSISRETLKSAELNHLPHGIKIRAKYRNSPCENCNEYYKSIWTGYIYSDWVDF